MPPRHRHRMHAAVFPQLRAYLIIVDDEQVSMRDVLQADDLHVLLRHVGHRPWLVPLIALIHLDVVERLRAPACRHN